MLRLLLIVISYILRPMLSRPAHEQGRNDLTIDHLLPAEEYKTRFQAAQTAMHRSLVVLIGLVAFWMAIENYYVRFADLYITNAKLNNISKEVYGIENKLRTDGYKLELAEKSALIRKSMLDKSTEELSKDIKDLKK